MKLIKSTYLYTSIWLVPFIIIGSFFSYYTIKYIAYEETDEFLTYEMERIVDFHQQNKDLPDFTNVADILEDVKLNSPVFKDTLMLETGDNEMVPYRELWFSIDHENRDFTLVLRQLLPGRDDILEGTLLIITGLMLLIALFLFLTVNLVTGRIWTPFYNTLNVLNRFRLSDPVPQFKNSNIDEFNSLNSTLQVLLKKVAGDYRHNKEFNENASHELQTHLSIIKAAAARLMDREDLQEPDLNEVGKIYSATTKLSQVQKSLLLLSKINNREFSNNEDVDLATVVETTLANYDEAIELRGITLTREISECRLYMDAGLAEAMANNVIKNAVKHNTDNGYIKIYLSGRELKVTNSGLPFNGEASSLLQRFSKGEGGNAGIGLAIVKEICDLYEYQISYRITGTTHQITISFNRK